MPEASERLAAKIEQLNQIGISLSGETDRRLLLEKIIIGAKTLTHADGGTLYLLEEGKRLRFEILHNDSLGIALGGHGGDAISLEPISLYDEKGNPLSGTIAAHAALSGQSVNIPDAYQAQGFDFSGTKKYDIKTGYRSTSFLAVPMRNHEKEVIGILQLINAKHEVSGDIRSFNEEDQRFAESLASQAAVALTNHLLIDELRNLLEKFIEVIADAIDEKSPYTGGHCRRVPDLAMLMAEAVNQVQRGPLASQAFNQDDLYELKIAALMHDCGKITTPVHVVDKATKLETIFDRIKLVEARVEILRKEAEIAALRRRLGEETDIDNDPVYRQTLNTLREDLAFLKRCNIGGEFMAEQDQARVEQIAQHKWHDNEGIPRPLLNENEIYNLQVAKGTLTPEERAIINSHINTTIRMLESLPFPKHLKRVPEIAGGHHERMDGKGYPRGLQREQMSLQARLMGIADVFEALTAADRPYKQAMPVSQALTILGRMKEDGHIDPDLFDVFVHEKVYLKYAEASLRPEQNDAVDFSKIPGYRPL